MKPTPLLPRWAPRVKPYLIRRLYESDAQGRLDGDLLDEVGWALHARCQSFLLADEAKKGRGVCPQCGASVPFRLGTKTTLRCGACGWACSARDYFGSIRNQQLDGGPEVVALFAGYVQAFPRARTPQEKMLLVDGLIHGFHHFLGSGRTRRPVAVNLIDGHLGFVVEFLDRLSSGPQSTPGVGETAHAWRDTVRSPKSARKRKAAMSDYEQFLRLSAVPREVIDRFLDPTRPHWAQFDPEVGYTLFNDMPRDGIDGSRTISTTQANGARRMVAYTDRPCRINTYGDSFTQCHQVSDGETWQEILAAHFGEPLRNFGMGGFGVYQAYRRMLRSEQSADGAEYILFYVWGDDHLRSLLRCRYALIRPWWDNQGGRAFHCNFWSNLEMDLESGKLEEHPNRLPTRESLYRMTDPDFMVDALRDDWMLQIAAFCDGHIQTVDREPLNRLAEILGCPAVPKGDREAMRPALFRLRDVYGFAATRHILDRADEFVKSRGKKMMVILFEPGVTRSLILNGSRYDQEIVDYLDRQGLRYFDMNLVHVKDFRCFKLSLEDYYKRYFIGHYNPAGNHFFAFALKDALVDWLEPKPVTYRADEQSVLRFEGYLPG